MQVWYRTVSLVTSSKSKRKILGKNFVGDTSLSEKFSWMEANHENNEIKSTTKIFMYTVLQIGFSRNTKCANKDSFRRDSHIYAQNAPIHIISLTIATVHVSCSY